MNRKLDVGVLNKLMLKLRKQVKKLNYKVTVLKSLLRNQTVDIMAQLGIKGEVLPDGRFRLEDGRVVGTSASAIEAALDDGGGEQANVRLHAVTAAALPPAPSASAEATKKLLHDQRTQFQKRLDKSKVKLAGTQQQLDAERRQALKAQTDYIHQIDSLNATINQLSQSLKEQQSIYETKMADAKRSHEQNIKEFVNNQLSLQVEQRKQGSTRRSSDSILLAAENSQRRRNGLISPRSRRNDETKDGARDDYGFGSGSDIEDEELSFADGDTVPLSAARGYGSAGTTPRGDVPPIRGGTSQRRLRLSSNSRQQQTQQQRRRRQRHSHRGHKTRGTVSLSDSRSQPAMQHMKQQFEHWMNKRSHEITTFVKQLNAFYAHKKRQVQEYRTEISQLYAHCNRLTNIIVGFQQGRYDRGAFAGLHPIAAEEIDSASQAFEDMKQRLKYLRAQAGIAGSEPHAVAPVKRSTSPKKASNAGASSQKQRASSATSRTGTVATIHRLKRGTEAD